MGVQILKLVSNSCVFKLSNTILQEKSDHEGLPRGYCCFAMF